MSAAQRWLNHRGAIRSVSAPIQNTAPEKINWIPGNPSALHPTPGPPFPRTRCPRARQSQREDEQRAGSPCFRANQAEGAALDLLERFLAACALRQVPPALSIQPQLLVWDTGVCGEAGPALFCPACCGLEPGAASACPVVLSGGDSLARPGRSRITGRAW